MSMAQKLIELVRSIGNDVKLLTQRVDDAEGGAVGALTEAEAQTGTSAVQRTISAVVLKGAIGYHGLKIGTTATTAKAGNWLPAWGDVGDKPAFIAAGNTQAAARSAIGAGTSSLAIGSTSSTAKAGNWLPSVSDVTGLADALAGKVDKVTGKGLSSEDFTAAYKSKLDGVEAGAQVNPVIVNGLASDDASKVLSAAQGKVLKGLIDNINTLLQSDDSTLDELQEIVDFVKLNRAELDSLGISSIAGLQQALDERVLSTDTRLTNSREWTASTVTQAEAEAGTATTRRAWTAQRVWQAITAWWNASAAKTKLDGIAAGATANATDAYLLNRANHTGTQPASTITGLATVATTGSYNDLTGKPTIPAAQVPADWNATSGVARILNKPTLGTAASANVSDLATAAQGVKADTAYGWGNHASAGYALASSLAAVATSGSYNDLSNKPTIPTLPATVSQAEAEAGSATTARLWTSQRVRQAITGWWNSVTVPLSKITGLGNAATSTVTANADDVTAGRLLKVGDNIGFQSLRSFGNYYPSTAGRDIDGVLAGDKGLYATSNPGTWPVGGGGFLYIETQSTYSGEASFQTAYSYTSTGTPENRKWIRFKANATGSLWGDWQEFWHSGNFNPATKVDGTDSRLTNSREWTASTVSQAEAEAGTATTARKWTAQRVWQAIAKATAAAAVKLSTARTLTIGSTGKTFDGSANVSWSLSEIGAAAASHSHNYLPLAGGTLSGPLNFTGSQAANFLRSGVDLAGGTGYGTFWRNDGNHLYLMVTAQNDPNGSWTTARPLQLALSTGVLNINGSSTKLQDARTINGTNFDGSANITTANWGTARNLTIGRTAKSVNGSANVAWTADEVLPTGTNGQVLKHNGTSWVAGTDNNTTYSTISDAEATAGTSTASRLVTPARLKLAVEAHAVPTATGQALEQRVSQLEASSSSGGITRARAQAIALCF